jgi:flavin-dependent dehydrogenase
VESLGGGRLEAGVYGNQVPGLGYVWVFPLGSNQYHIGIGGIGHFRPESVMDRFYQDQSSQFAFTPICTCQGDIRVASPYYSRPLYQSKYRHSRPPQLIVGVGESIGTVAPFTGEGIVYSLDCAKMLAESFTDPERYSRMVLTRFAWMRKERETLDYLLVQGRESGPRLRDRWRFYRNARRSGIRLPLMEAFRRMGSLTQWLDNPE